MNSFINSSMMIHILPLLVPCCLIFLFVYFLITCTYFNPRTSRNDLSSAAAVCNNRPTPMAWNRAYCSHTLQGQKLDDVATNASVAFSTSSDADDYEVNNEQKSSCPMVPENWVTQDSVSANPDTNDLDYVNAFVVANNQHSLTLPHPNRSATFSGILAKGRQQKSLLRYVNPDDSWLNEQSVHYEGEVGKASISTDIFGTHRQCAPQALPSATWCTETDLVPQVTEGSHSYQNIPSLCSQSRSIQVANFERHKPTREILPRDDESQVISRLDSLTFHSAFVTSICRALEEEGRQAETDMEAEQDGYIHMQSVSLKAPETKEMIVIKMEEEVDEEEHSYYNVIPKPRT